MEGENKSPLRGRADDDDAGFVFDRDQKTENVRSSKEKMVSTAVAVTVFIAVIAVFASIKNINRPAWEIFPAINNNAACPNGQCGVKSELADLFASQGRDTDSDGLSDYEETYVYASSPYLADTDSDGFNDKEELDKGYDPNCAGESCVVVAETGSGAAAKPAADNSIGNQILSGQATPAMIRSLLLERGVKQTDLDRVNDSDLMKLYREMLGGGATDSGGGNAAVATTTGQTIQSLEQLRALSGAQIRALLVKQGAPEAILNQLSDEQLKTMFISQLEEQLAGNTQ